MTEYMTAQEAVTWIMTGDAEFSSRLRDEGPIAWAVRLSLREIETPRIRKSERATRLLADRCAAGRVLSKGYRVGTDILSVIDTAEWLNLKVTTGFEIATKHGRAVFLNPVFRRKDVIDQFQCPADKVASRAMPADSNGISHHQPSLEHAPKPPVAPSLGRRGQMSRNLTAALREEFGVELGRSSRDMSRAQNAVAAWHRRNADARLPEERNWRRNIDRIWSS